MSSKLKKISPILKGIAILAFWLLIWEIVALIINQPFFLPGIGATFKELFLLFGKSSFYTSVIFTFLRVIAGLSAGVTIGVLTAVLSHHFPIIRDIISPLISVIKATPVASFIILLWILMSGNALTIFIAFLMVFPIIWQNVLDAYDSIDKELSEVCDVFEFSFKKRMKYLTLPALSKYFAPALITSVGLAWKSEIAAEIIAYTTKSIGQYINDAKLAYNTSVIFAWTLVVITLSIILEKTTKFLLKRWSE